MGVEIADERLFGRILSAVFNKQVSRQRSVKNQKL